VVIGAAEYGRESGIDSYASISESARMYAEVLGQDPMWPDPRLVTEDELRTTDGVMRAVQDVADRAAADEAFMVVYVGHGAHWRDIPDSEVHFSVGSSRRDSPWTWLASWYLYRAMRKSHATLKVLIADCCYSNKLPRLGEPPKALDTLDRGTCVLTATKNDHNYADPEGCPELPDSDLRKCTPFSGHLLNVLRRGTSDHNDKLTLGLVRDAVETEMGRCHTSHRVPNMTLNGARERTALFTNRRNPAERSLPPIPNEAEQWADILIRGQEPDLESLFLDPRQTGKVVAKLYERQSDHGRVIADRINEQASQQFEPRQFARYWNQVERAPR
jgi:hypothetical protein